MITDDSPIRQEVSNTNGVSCVFDLPASQHQYLFPEDKAGGMDLVQFIQGTKEWVRPGKGSSGKKRKRELRKKPGHLYFPVVADTEFQTIPHPDTGWFHDQVLEFVKKLGRGSIPISIQLRSIAKKAPSAIYLHPDFRKLFPKCEPEGLKEAKEPIADYMSDLLGNKVEFDWKGSIEHDDYKGLKDTRKLRLKIYAHFALAELHRVWGDRRIVDYIKKHCRADRDGGRPEASFQQGRRLRTSFKVEGNPVPEQWLPVPIVVVIGKRKFALEIDFYDNSGMVGEAGRSFKGFMAVTGVGTDSKDNFTTQNKERMFPQFVALVDQKGYKNGAYDDFFPKSYDIANDTALALEGGPDRFIDYAIGDVQDLYEGICALTEKFKRIYKQLGLEHYYTLPKPTTGSTVHEMIRASLYKMFEGVFAGKDEYLTKVEKHVMDKVELKGFDSLTEKQQPNFPHWYFGQEEKLHNRFHEIIEKQGFDPAAAMNIATKKYWSGINAKVLGGRCINSAPTMISAVDKLIADVDLKGCYVAGMFNQGFPIGRPVILGELFARSSKRNGFPTLKEFLKDYRSELVPSLWQAWISIEDKNGEPIELPEDQDFFPSWKAPISFFDYEEDEEGVWLERQDQVRHYKRRILNTPLTHDGLQWLEHVATESFRKFVMENAVVKTAMFYPKSQRVKGPQEWVDGYEKFKKGKKRNKSKLIINPDGSPTVRHEDNEYRQWYSVNLADLIARSLKMKRNEWRTITNAYGKIKWKKVKNRADYEALEPNDKKKIDAALYSETLGSYPGGLEALIAESKIYKKHPLDELFKLCGNTVYGVIVSRFFTLSNPCVANNVTARCRAMIALYQGACRGWNAITDGGLMRLDQVFYPRNGRKLNHKAGLMVEATEREINTANMRSGPIGDYDNIEWDGDEIVFTKDSDIKRFHKSDDRKEDGSGYLDLVDDLILNHVRLCYSDKIDILKKDSPFAFETKGIVKSASLHGAGNYYLEGGKHEGYGKDENDEIIDNMVKMRSYSAGVQKSVIKPFFLQILHNPKKVDRTDHSRVFVISQILKVGAYDMQFKSYYQHTDLEPGDTIYQARMFRELGLTGFMFNSPEQEKEYRDFHNYYRSIHNERKSVGQSWEGFYLDDELFYDYDSNVRDLARDIENNVGVTNKTPSQHHNTTALQYTRTRLRAMMLRDPALKLDPYQTDESDIEVSDADIAEIEMFYQELPDEDWF